MLDAKLLDGMASEPATRQRRSNFFIMEILASQLIPSELSSSSHKLSYEPRKS